jgi:two-component system response regulator PilR (NtrC family)
MNASILVVDDEHAIQDSLAWCLRTDGHEVQTAEDGEEAMAIMAAQDFDVVISDIIMPGVSGLDLLRKARALHPRTLVVLITAYATVETAVEAFREGASDYVLKPFKFDDLRFRVQRLLEYRSAFQESAQFRGAVERATTDNRLLGEGAAMQAVKTRVAKAGPASSNVLITGESGTGKELVARAIHAASPRSGQAFVPINCGRFRRRWKARLARRRQQTSPGLRTTHDLSRRDREMPVQVKLRARPRRSRFGRLSVKPLRVDIRIIASTNRDLDKEVEAGRFRDDLYYRLKVVQIVLPPLRERREDIPLLVGHFIRQFNLNLSRQVIGVDPEALRALMGGLWKGNVRELEHVIESAMMLSEGEVLTVGDLPRSIVGGATPQSDSLRDVSRQSERQHIMAVLAQTQFDKREAARILGISLASLYRKLGELGISDSPLQN